MEIQVLRKKSKDDSKEIAKLKYENEDLQCCLMSSMEDNDSLKKQIKELKEKSNSQDFSSSAVFNTQENLKMKADFADLKSAVEELNSNLLKVNQENDVLLASNKSLSEKIDLLKDQVKKQKCRASVAEFEVESLRKCKDELAQKVQSLEHNNNNNNYNNNNVMTSTYDNNAKASLCDSLYNNNGQHFAEQGFGSPNVSSIYFDIIIGV